MESRNDVRSCMLLLVAVAAGLVWLGHCTEEGTASVVDLCTLLNASPPSSWWAISPVNITSNTVYNLHNCNVSLAPSITTMMTTPPLVMLVLRPNTSSSPTALSNVHISVIGGNVLPMLCVTNPIVAMRNVTIDVRRVVGTVHADHRDDGTPTNGGVLLLNDSSRVPLSLLGYSTKILTTTFSATDITVNVENSSIRMFLFEDDNDDAKASTITGDKQVSNSVDTALLLFLSSDNVGDFFIARVTITIAAGTTIEIALAGNGTRSATAVSYLGNSVASDAGPAEKIIHNVSINLSNGSAIRLLHNATLATVEYRTVEPSLFIFACPQNNTNCRFENISVTCTNGSALSLVQLAPGVYISTTKNVTTDETASIVAFKNVRTVVNIIIRFVGSVNVSVRSECAARCTALGVSNLEKNDDRIYFRAVVVAFVYAVGGSDIIAILNVCVSNGTIVCLDAPKSVALLYIKASEYVRHTSVGVLHSKFQLISQKTRLGMNTRSQSLLDLAVDVQVTTDVTVRVAHSNITFVAESGGCNIVTSTLLQILTSRLERCTVTIDDVRVVSDTINGTVDALASWIQPMTMLTSFVNFAGASNSTATNLNITICRSSLAATHSCALVSNVTPIILSVMAAISTTQALSNCTFLLADVGVLRRYPQYANASSYISDSVPSARFNITTLVNLLDASSFAANSTPGITELMANPFVKMVIASLSTFASANSTVTGLTCHVSSSSSVRYDCRLASELRNAGLAWTTTPMSPELIAYVTLPKLLIDSTIRIEGDNNNNNSRKSRCQCANDVDYYGCVIGAYGDVTLRGSHVSVSNINCVAALLHSGPQPMIAYQPYGAAAANSSIDGGDSSISAVFQFENVTLRCQRAHGRGISRHDASFAGIGTNGSAVLMNVTPRGAALFSVTRCVFSNFTSLLMSSALPFRRDELGDEGPPPVLRMGCNVWGGVPLSPLLVGYNLKQFPLFVDYPRSNFNETFECPGFQTATSSLEWLPEPPPQDPLMAAPLIPAPLVASLVAVAGVLGALMVEASGGLLDAQVLVAMGQSSCAPATLRASTSASRFLMSPFYSLGVVAVVFGNLGVFVALHGLHQWLLHQHLRSTSRSSQFQRQVDELFPPALLATSRHVPTHKLSQLSSAVQAVPLLPAAARAQFPNHTITAAMFLVPGVVHGGTRGLFSREVAGSVAGVAAVLAVGSGGWWRARAGRSLPVSRFRFTVYRHSVRQAFAVPCALPLGQWGPAALRATHGRLRGSVRVGMEWLSMLPLSSALLVQGVASIPIPPSWCAGMWFVLVGIHLLTMSAVIACRPGRAPLSDGLQAASLIVAAAVQIASAMSHFDMEVDGLISLLVILNMCTSLSKTVHNLFIIVWERNASRNNVQVGQTDVVGCARQLLVPHHRQQRNERRGGGGGNVAQQAGSLCRLDTNQPLRTTQTWDVNDALEQLLRSICEH